MKLNAKLNVLIMILIYLGSNLTAAGQQDNSGKPKVVSTTSILTDVIRNITGDRVELTGLIKVGQDPHGYEPTPRDMARVEEADVLFLNGYNLEESLVGVLETVSTNLVVEVSGEIDHHDGLDEHDEHDEHNHGGIDPHTWMSPLNVIRWSETIADTLAETDPENGSFYRDNAASYIQKLEVLHHEIQDAIDAIPEENRVLVTDHMAFGYYADEYGLDVAGTILPDTSASSDVSAKHLADLVHILNERHISAVFIGDTAGVDIRNISEAIQNELGRPIEILSLLTGSLKAEGDQGDSYLEYMRFNTKQIVKGLKEP